jgi:hypothetical protein
MKMNAKLKIAAALFIAVGTVFAQDTGLNQRKQVITDCGLAIHVSEITEKALFYPY